MLPPIISALGMQVFWLSTGHVGRIENVIIAHAIFFSTLPLVTISLAMETMDQALPGGRPDARGRSAHDVPDHHAAAADPLDDHRASRRRSSSA